MFSHKETFHTFIRIVLFHINSPQNKGASSSPSGQWLTPSHMCRIAICVTLFSHSQHSNISKDNTVIEDLIFRL